MIWASNAKTALAIVLMLCGAIESTAASAGTHILYQFSGGADGNGPVGPLVLDAAGDLFGTTGYGGQNGVGTVFELKPGGSNWTETVLHSFGPQDGGEGTQHVVPALVAERIVELLEPIHIDHDHRERLPLAVRGAASAAPAAARAA